MRDFLAFPNFGTILFWPISLLIISSGSSGLFKFGCFNYIFLKIYLRDKLEKGPSKFLAYIRNTIPAKSFWTPSEESPPPLPLFPCCSDDVDFSFDFFPTCKTTLGKGSAKCQTKCCYDVRDFLAFPNFGTILFWPISLLIISSGSSGLFKFGCFNYIFLKIYLRDKLEKGPSKFLAYIRNTIPAKSFWTPSEESPPPLPLFPCCSDDVDFSFDFFPTCKTTLGKGYGGKRKPLSNVIV